MIIRNKVKEIVKSTGLHIILGKLRFSFAKGKSKQILHFLTRGHLFRRYRIKKYLFVKRNTFKKLQIGGGYHTKHNWINGDIIAGNIYLNATKKLPFPDNSLDFIFTEQFIEHITQEDAITFMHEAYRILKPGGVIRQSTPDMEKLILVYQDNNPEVDLGTAVTRHMRNHRRNTPFVKPCGCQFLNDFFRLWGHQFIYDRDSMLMLTKEAGFRNFRWVAFGKSDNADLKHLERHANVEWMKNGISMFCEAEKPDS